MPATTEPACAAGPPDELAVPETVLVEVESEVVALGGGSGSSGGGGPPKKGSSVPGFFSFFGQPAQKKVMPNRTASVLQWNGVSRRRVFMSLLGPNACYLPAPLVRQR